MTVSLVCFGGSRPSRPRQGRPSAPPGAGLHKRARETASRRQALPIPPYAGGARVKPSEARGGAERQTGSRSSALMEKMTGNQRAVVLPLEAQSVRKHDPLERANKPCPASDWEPAVACQIYAVRGRPAVDRSDMFGCQDGSAVDSGGRTAPASVASTR